MKLRLVLPAALLALAVASLASAAAGPIEFSPTSGPPGTVLTITGERFLTRPIQGIKLGCTDENQSCARMVHYNYRILSDTTLTVPMPVVRSGGVVVKWVSGGGTGNDRNFIVTEPPPSASAPQISSFTPSSGPVGTTVTVSGQHLDTVNAVYFRGGVSDAQSFTVLSPTKLTAVVPPTHDGRLVVTSPEGVGESADSFTITSATEPAGAPTISFFTPASAPVGARVSIYGTNMTGASAVEFNGTNAGFVYVSAGQLAATVPIGATAGPLSVTTAAGTTTSTGSFTVSAGSPPDPPEPHDPAPVTSSAPAISSFTPAAGPVGTTVTISGERFSAVSAVRFNGSAAQYTVVSGGTIAATVPAGATAGPVSVTTAAGTATSTGSFTVSAGGSLAPPASAPTVTLTAPSHLTATGATVNGIVDPHGLATTVVVEYGSSLAYGKTTGTGAIAAGAGTTAVSFPLGGLTARTTYHYRLVATSNGGQTRSNDAAFTTAAPTSVPPPLAPQPVTPLRAAAAPQNKVAPVLSGSPRVGRTLTCSPGTWTGAPTLSFSWRRGGSVIAKAAGRTYRLAAADAGRRIACVVTATNAGGSAVATSKPRLGLRQPACRVPELARLPLVTAKARLRKAGCTPGLVRSVYSAEVPTGSVLGQQPSARHTARYRAKVALVVSRGARPQRSRSADGSHVLRFHIGNS